MAKWVSFNGDGSIFSSKQQQLLGFSFRKIKADLFELNTDQQVFDVVCVMIQSSLLTLEIKIRADGSVELKWQSRVPQKSDMRKLVEAQQIGRIAEKVPPIGAQSDEAGK